jgi:asparagine synthase (glutamine-hydrolysing)
MMIVDVNSYLPFNQLTYTDRMTMAQSLELRVPFVDQKLIDVAGGIPLHWKIPRGVTKGLFREAMAPFLPAEVLQFPKRGLNLPLSSWFRNELRSWVRSLLAPDRLSERGYFRPEAVQALIEFHEKGLRDCSLFLWAVVALEVWHQIYVDQKPARGVEAF